MNDASKTAERKSLRFPTAFTILFGLTILVAALTWIILAGQYQSIHNAARDHDVPVAGTYQITEPNPQGVFDVIMAPVGGFIGVVAVSGAFDAGSPVRWGCSRAARNG